MTFSRVVPVVVASVLCGGCGVPAADGEESESADVANTSDEADEGETSEDGDDTGLTLADLDEVCRATKTRKGCAAALLCASHHFSHLPFVFQLLDQKNLQKTN